MYDTLAVTGTCNKRSCPSAVLDAICGKQSCRDFAFPYGVPQALCPGHGLTEGEIAAAAVCSILGCFGCVALYLWYKKRRSKGKRVATTDIDY